MAKFEGYERREAKILAALAEYGISSIDECKEICDAKGIDPYTITQETQPICFENAKWAYTVGSAIAIKEAEREAKRREIRRRQEIKERARTCEDKFVKDAYMYIGNLETRMWDVWAAVDLLGGAGEQGTHRQTSSCNLQRRF